MPDQGCHEALIRELREMAEGDVREMKREIRLHDMFHRQFVDEHDLDKWAALMDRAADALAERLTCRTCVQLRPLMGGVFSCPVANIRLHANSVDEFGCIYHERDESQRWPDNDPSDAGDGNQPRRSDAVDPAAPRTVNGPTRD